MTKNERILIMTATTLYKQHLDVMNAQINKILSHLGHNVNVTCDSEAIAEQAEQFKQMLECQDESEE